ncbi:MAG: hypothetical protein IJ692_03940 [Alloprevotella sp.]|nr:hypothetical protein [Alloprevotella sp.]
MLKTGYTYIIYIMTLLLLLACNKEEYVDAVDDQPVDVSFTFSISSARRAASRMSADVTQTNSTYRGIDDIRLIPFRVRGAVTASERPLLATIGTGAEGGIFDKTATDPPAKFYLYDDCWLMPGTASFLFYGKGSPVTGRTEKPHNGSLVETFPDNLYPEGISFRPDAIRDNNDAPAAATALAAYLTHIAQTPGWASTRHPALRTYFLNFTGQVGADQVLMAGAGFNVRAHVNALYGALSGLTLEAGSDEATLRNAVLTRISSYGGITFNDGTKTVTSLGSTLDGYPGNVDLPDGAAALRWNGSAFAVQTETTTLAPINNLGRFAYPADLRYYANSQIATSNLDKRTQYYAPSATWSEVLSNYEMVRAAVTPGTQAVALIEPIQYAVACLQLSLGRLTSATLKDAAGADVTVGEGYFPLTGVIVGAQHPVDFSFTPQLPQSDVATRFAYDRDTEKTGGGYHALSAYNQSEPVSTLVLQSYDEEEVPIVLEFTNQSGQAFRSLTGIVYPGTKFYLVGKLKPDEVTASTPDYQRRVFTKDYTTTTTMRVVSFANAYNILPDLLLPRLEVGVEIVTDWMQAEPGTVEIY